MAGPTNSVTSGRRVWFAAAGLCAGVRGPSSDRPKRTTKAPGADSCKPTGRRAANWKIPWNPLDWPLSTRWRVGDGRPAPGVAKAELYFLCVRTCPFPDHLAAAPFKRRGAPLETINMYLPTIVALSAVATIGYLVGRRGKQDGGEIHVDKARRELKCAKAVALQLEGIAARIRKNLSTHESSIAKFKDRVIKLGTQEETAAWTELFQEVDEMLKPTLNLVAQISCAYDELREQSSHLLTFTESRTDPLTGVSNRKALDETLDASFALFARYEQPFSLALFDIDHFKRVNDVQGHVRGDQILQIVAHKLDDATRDTDLVARDGGEEFVVVMPQTEADGAAVYADRILRHSRAVGAGHDQRRRGHGQRARRPQNAVGPRRRRPVLRQGGRPQPDSSQYGHQRRTLAGRYAGNVRAGGHARKGARLALESLFPALRTVSGKSRYRAAVKSVTSEFTAWCNPSIGPARRATYWKAASSCTRSLISIAIWNSPNCGGPNPSFRRVMRKPWIKCSSRIWPRYVAARSQNATSPVPGFRLHHTW